jgi:hypothetical protein
VAVAQALERCDQGQQCLAGWAGFGRPRFDMPEDADQLVGGSRERAGRQRLDHHRPVQVDDAGGILQHRVGEGIARPARGLPGGDADFGMLHQPRERGRVRHIS